MARKHNSGNRERAEMREKRKFNIPSCDLSAVRMKLQQFPTMINELQKNWRVLNIHNDRVTAGLHLYLQPLADAFIQSDFYLQRLWAIES